MVKQKNPEKDYRKDQPVNKPFAIAKAIAALAADERNHGEPTMVVSLTILGEAVVCVGDKYYQTEDLHEKFLPQTVSTDVTENWKQVLKINPFKHMSEGQ
jgi:hypothetical protein